MAPLADDTCSAGTCKGDGPPRRPLLHFLFLLRAGIVVKPEIWAEYFKPAPSDAYMIWAHCADYDACEKDPGLRLLNARLVPTVHNARWYDLMTPTTQLLRHAMASTEDVASGLQEKFLTLSESHLPIKPFQVAYSDLTSNASSDFCFMNPLAFANSTIDGVPVVIAKHATWMSLNRHDASLLVRHWTANITAHRWTIPLKGGEWDGQNRTVSRLSFRRTSGTHNVTPPSLEEAPHAIIHGPIRVPEPGDLTVPSEVFRGRRCHTYAEFPAAVGWPNRVKEKYYVEGGPGKARTRPTFAFKYEESLVTSAIIEDEGSRLSVEPGAMHPFAMEVLTNRSMKVFRESEFLFARKFKQSSSLPYFADIMFRV